MRKLHLTSERNAHEPHLQGSQRPGFVYIVVLGLTVLVFIMGMSAMRVARTEISVVGGLSDWHEARQLALAAIEHGIAEINHDPDWRETFANDAAHPTVSGTTLGNGSFVWKLVDADGNLNNGNSDPVRVHGIGYVGETVYAASVKVEPTGTALSCLQTSLHADGVLDLDFGTITSNQTISTNSNASAGNGATVNAKVQASGSISGATWNGVNTPAYPARSVPDVTTVFDYYNSNGEQIPVTSLPILAGDRYVEELLLSPAANPFGATNSDGIYVIDCQGATLVIRNCRVVGTLVLLNCGDHSRIEGSVSMEPALDYFPTLLVDDTFELSFTQTQLTESFYAVNFNPASVPFPYIHGQGNNTDADFSDSYPSRITGLVYVRDKLKMPTNAPTIHGCVVTGGEFELQSATLSLKYRETYLSFPPPGFTSGDIMDISPGTWRREVP